MLRPDRVPPVLLRPTMEPTRLVVEQPEAAAAEAVPTPQRPRPWPPPTPPAAATATVPTETAQRIDPARCPAATTAASRTASRIRRQPSSRRAHRRWRRWWWWPAVGFVYHGDWTTTRPSQTEECWTTTRTRPRPVTTLSSFRPGPSRLPCPRFTMWSARRILNWNEQSVHKKHFYKSM